MVIAHIGYIMQMRSVYVGLSLKDIGFVFRRFQFFSLRYRIDQGMYWFSCGCVFFPMEREDIVYTCGKALSFSALIVAMIIEVALPCWPVYFMIAVPMSKFKSDSNMNNMFYNLYAPCKDTAQQIIWCIQFF